MRYYVALVHKEEKSDFGVSFPDFPGCISAGSTLDEAALMATEALNGHADLMAAEGETIPEPSTLDVIMSDQGYRDGIPMLIGLKQAPGSRVVRVNITVPEDFLQAIDAHAARQGMNRSGFLVRAAKREMEQA